MDKGQALIQIYRTCFYISVGITVLGLASAVFLFFKFDIRTIFEIRSGRAAKRTIQKMKQANAATGRLRQQEEMDYTTGGLADNALQNKNPEVLSSGSLKQQTPPSTGETMQLPQEAPVPPPPPASVQEPESVPTGFQFVITQSLMLIHTEEQL